MLLEVLAPVIPTLIVTAQEVPETLAHSWC